MASKMRIATRRQSIGSSVCFRGTPDLLWLGLPRRTPSNDTMVMSSFRKRHRRKRVTFCSQKECNQPCQKGSGTSSYALHRTSTSSASGVREPIRDDLRRRREQQFFENVTSFGGLPPIIGCSHNEVQKDLWLCISSCYIYSPLIRRPLDDLP
jgi:hypothetical protein